MRWPSACSRAMSATVRRRMVSGWALMSASSLRGGVAGVQRGGDPVEDGVGDLALGLQGQVVARPVGGEDADPVGVGAEAGAGLGDVVGHEQVDALASELVRGAVERAGLGREADEDRGGRDRARSSRSPVRSVPWTSRAIWPRTSGVGSSSRVRPAPRSSLWSARVDRPEVGDGRGHDQRVEAGRAVRRRGSSRWSAVRSSAVDSTRTTVAPAGGVDLDVGGDER